MQNTEYMNRWGVSQSMIKAWNYKSPKQWKDIYIDRKLDLEKNEDTFTMGSLIDTILFSPEDLVKRFFIGEEKLPSKAIAWIVKNYYSSIIKENVEIEEMNKVVPEDSPLILMEIDGATKLLLDSANNYCYKDGEEEKCGWNVGWKDETRVRTLIEKGSDYFNSLKKAAGRKIISHEMNVQALQLVDILRSHPEVKDYFVPSEHNLLMFQLELYIDVQIGMEDKTMPLKGALDIVRFNHLDKTVQIIDFKSSYSAFGFLHSIKQFGYCDQLSYYDFLLREWLKLYCDGSYCEYKMIPPINVVIDINDKEPYIYEYDWKDIALSADGNKEFLYSLYQTYDHNARIKRGWKRLLEDITWHYQRNLWNKPRELYETKRIKVNLLNS